MVANGMEGVPWMVGGGAKHSANVGRVLAYMAASGQGGITSPADLKVSQSSVPDGNVHVGTGALSILNLESNSKNEAYIGRATAVSDLPIAPTGSSIRSDLVVVRVRDPQYGYATPSDPVVGPYIFPEVVPGVPAGTLRADQVATLLNKAIYALARVDVPANSTGPAITSGYIHDLRQLAHHHYDAFNALQRGPVPDEYLLTSDTNWKNFPSNVASLTIPPWATHADLEIFVTVLVNADANMQTQITLGGTPVGPEAVFDTNMTPTPDGNAVLHQHLTQAVGVDVRSLAGQTVNLRLRAYRTFPTVATGNLGIDQYGQVRFRAEFFERPV
jgi:hypothetical protein